MKLRSNEFMFYKSSLIFLKNVCITYFYKYLRNNIYYFTNQISRHKRMLFLLF